MAENKSPLSNLSNRFFELDWWLSARRRIRFTQEYSLFSSKYAFDHPT